MGTIRVLSPVGVGKVGEMALPPLPADLQGRVVGLLDNTKANFELLLGRLGELLRERYGIKGVVYRRKANSSTPAPPDLLADLARSADVVITGSAD